MRQTQFGIDRLDELFHGLYPGECVLWRISSSACATSPLALGQAAQKADPRSAIHRVGSGKLAVDIVKQVDSWLSEDSATVLIVDLTASRPDGAETADKSDGVDRLRTVIERVFASDKTVHLITRSDQIGAVSTLPAAAIITVDTDTLRIDRSDGRAPSIAGLILTYSFDDDGALSAGAASAASLLGRGLLSLRKERNWSQADLGHLIGVSGSAIGQAERGQHALSLESILDLSEKTGVNIERLLRGTSPPRFAVNRANLDGVQTSGTLFADPQHALSVTTTSIAPRGSTTPKFSNGPKSIVVLVGSGFVNVVMEHGQGLLRSGDALRVDGKGRLSVRNIGDDHALVFWLVFD